MERVAVTGMGIVSPIGNDAGSFWRNLLAGQCAIAPMPNASNRTGNALWAAVPDGFLDGSPLPRTALKHADRFTQYAIAAAYEALERARLAPSAPLRHSRDASSSRCE